MGASLSIRNNNEPRIEEELRKRAVIGALFQVKTDYPIDILLHKISATLGDKILFWKYEHVVENPPRLPLDTFKTWNYFNSSGKFVYTITCVPAGIPETLDVSI